MYGADADVVRELSSVLKSGHCHFIMEISTDDHRKLATQCAGTNLRVFRIAPKLSLICR